MSTALGAPKSGIWGLPEATVLIWTMEFFLLSPVTVALHLRGALQEAAEMEWENGTKD